jgi:hypothetical protein
MRKEIIRPALAVLSVAAFGCIAAIAEDQLNDETIVGAICRPHRPAYVTYGGLTPRHGFERDHRVPLCLGGPDTPDNVWYEPLDEALVKDNAEHNACRHACHAGPAAIEKAREDFRIGNWRKWLER